MKAAPEYVWMLKDETLELIVHVILINKDIKLETVSRHNDSLTQRLPLLFVPSLIDFKLGLQRGGKFSVNFRKFSFEFLLEYGLQMEGKSPKEF